MPLKMPVATINYPIGPRKSPALNAFIITMHAIGILLIWLSPFLFRWPLIILGITAYFLQLLIVGDCVMNKWQFGTKKREITFYYFILTKMGFRLKPHRVRHVADYVMPLMILGIALIWQIFLDKTPLIF